MHPDIVPFPLSLLSGAVRAMMESHGLNGSSESAPVVLDIGTGTGLLAMLAIKARAPSVIGEGNSLTPLPSLAHMCQLEQSCWVLGGLVGAQ